MLEIESYFSLKHFRHRALWQEGNPLWFPLVCLNDYLKTQRFQIEIQIPSGVYLENPDLISIGKGTLIEPGVFIKGPCIIGKNCILRHGAYLRDGVICADHCAIGHNAEIKHSVILDGSAVTHFCYVGDSIIGAQANLGAGVKCSNLRLDRREVSIVVDNKKRIRTGLKKFGAMIGDRVQIGCNCVLNPGTLIGKNSICYPLLNVGGMIPSYSKIARETKVKIGAVSSSLLEFVENVHVP